MTTKAQEQLLRKARKQGEQIEAARQLTLRLAGERQTTILDLHQVHGLSVRGIAVELGVSAEVVAEAIRKARRAGVKVRCRVCGEIIESHDKSDLTAAGDEHAQRCGRGKPTLELVSTVEDLQALT